ncbi:E3 ubiquitin-protein ligase RNF26 [Phoenix dactylifera]|uniref:E3 ubiquitin-protein ligase RNF26 n=1 Tax=Phoenix dactylifera TaxID=42345 RepID=A0A8B7CPG3_PHODC|nr:E3 ubiquitin-protein ligase RNF26 [Phoenix dactylifera]
MERGERGMGARQRWRRFKDRLRFKGVACCGSPWARSRAAHIDSRSPFDFSTASSGEDAGSPAAAERGGPRYRREAAAAARNRRESDQDFGCILDQAPAGDAVTAIEEEEEEEEMNLAMALAAERQLRATERDMTMTPFSERSSLMRLMREGEEEKREEAEEEEGREWWGCCVCMGRRKGAAFIPCGHTFCRVCARELWITRGSCPLCNQSILETLDIY